MRSLFRLSESAAFATPSHHCPFPIVSILLSLAMAAGSLKS
jgi:hypothetical protein